MEGLAMVSTNNLSLAGKNILVTGGTGFVGAHLVEQLLKEKVRVATTYQSINPASYFFVNNFQQKTIMVNVDICDYEKVFDIVTKFEIDYIFHLAAQPLVEVAFHNPKRTLYSNILGTVNVLESARLYPRIKAVIIASSDKAYGKLKKSKYYEGDPLRGDHPYEASKSSVDLISFSYFKTYNLPVVVTRFGNIYGEGDLNFSRIIPGIIKSIIERKTLEVRSDGKYVRDYLYVKDVVSGYLLLVKNIKKAKGEAFNFGSKETFSVLDLIRLAGKILKRKIRYKILNVAKNEIFYQSLDSQKIKKMIGWQQKYLLKSTLKKVFSWYKNYHFI